jgi:hypothetical protein
MHEEVPVISECEDISDTGDCTQDRVAGDFTKLTVLELIGENVLKAADHDSSQ